MASTSQPRRNYHVFLSFRGPDVRDNFLSHLYEALHRTGIHTYIDNEELKKGERISDALPKAIEDSRIALIVFSEDYATSQWCLKEVTKIMECKDSIGLLVLPVFFKVDPREVRGGRYSYKEAFGTYKKKCEDGNAVGFDLEDVKKWEEALHKAGELSGWVYNNRVITKVTDGNHVLFGSNEFKTEAELVRVIVNDISQRLERIPLNVFRYPVGTDSRVKDLISMLKMGPEDEAQDGSLMIGIWAMGGMGKTTLAIVLYNSIFENFGGAAFLDGISSDSEKLRHLQETMLRKLAKAEIGVTSPPEGIASIKERLKSTRVLLVLDGVDDKCQIDNLIGEEHDCFCKGSRIIVTTRNKNVLSKSKPIYEVTALEDHEARELFCICASEDGNEEISGNHENLVKSALQYTRRLPLALKELGYAFCGKSEHHRGIELHKFARLSSITIHNRLKKGLDGLDGTTKSIFLDIACFFNGWNRKYVEGLLGICYVKSCRDDCCYDDRCYNVAASKANDYVNDLIERSLITDENGTLQVHPLIELMGQTVADGEYPHILRTRSRIWHWDEVVKVLSEDKGKYDVEAIVLAPKEPKEMERIGSNPFKKLKKLRFLIMINVKLKTSFPGPVDLPDQLRWFEWPECPASSLKISSTPLNPAVLAVRKSLLIKKPGGNMI